MIAVSALLLASARHITLDQESMLRGIKSQVEERGKVMLWE